MNLLIVLAVILCLAVGAWIVANVDEREMERMRRQWREDDERRYRR